MIGNIHWLCGNANISQTLQREMFSGYVRIKIFTIFDNKLVMWSFPVVICCVGTKIYHKLCGKKHSLVMSESKYLDNKLVMQSFPVVMFLSMLSYQMLYWLF